MILPDVKTLYMIQDIQYYYLLICLSLLLYRGKDAPFIVLLLFDLYLRLKHIRRIHFYLYIHTEIYIHKQR